MTLLIQDNRRQTCHYKPNEKENDMQEVNQIQHETLDHNEDYQRPAEDTADISLVSRF